MQFKLFALISLASVVSLFSGCVSVKAHLAERDRVDQELPAGAEELYPNRAKTRQVIVVEVAGKNAGEHEKATPAAAAKPAEPSGDGQSQVVAAPKETVVVHSDNFSFPDLKTQELTQQPAAAQAGSEQYTVEKDDTLQKIAKRFYGSYSKWTVIYDANRDVIKDPNFLKPGKVLKIPVLATPAQETQPKETAANDSQP